MDKKIDIIIPAYNAHNTIGKTLASIVAQTMVSNIRVTIVNDCSDKDYSDFIKMYENLIDIREITLTEHHGCGRTRNVGIDNAEYEYIMFVDADDLFYSPLSVQKLYDIISQNNELNIVYGSFYEELTDGTLYYHPPTHFIWIFGSIFKRNFIEDNHIRFIDSSSGEDAGFNKQCKLLCRPENIYFYEDIIYFWSNMNEENRINNQDFVNVEGRVGYAKNLVEVYKLLKDKNVKCNFTEAKMDYLGNLVSIYFLCLIMEEAGFDKSLLIDVFKEFYQDWKDKYNKYITYNDYLFCFENNFDSHFKNIDFTNLEYSFNDFIYDLSDGENIDFIPELKDKKDNGLFFSIVIPAHNCEKTIDRLMESIINQEMNKDLYEVIFVNDNCSDNSVEKAAKYSDLVNLKIVNTSTDTHCPGNSRSAGLAAAAGCWVTFIDNDDMFADGIFSYVRNTIIKNHLQHIYFTSIQRIDYLTKEELKIYNTLDTFLHGKFYNRKFLKDYDIDFTKDLKTNEDSNFNFKVFIALAALGYQYAYDQNIGYIWINEENSLSNKDFDNYTCYIEINFNDYIKSAEPFFKQDDFCFSKIVSHLIKGYFYCQSSMWKRGMSDTLVNSNFVLLKDFANRILDFFSLSKDELINIIYSNPFEYNNLREVSSLSSYPFVETKSLADFIMEV